MAKDRKEENNCTVSCIVFFQITDRLPRRWLLASFDRNKQPPALFLLFAFASLASTDDRRTSSSDNNGKRLLASTCASIGRFQVSCALTNATNCRRENTSRLEFAVCRRRASKNAECQCSDGQTVTVPKESSTTMLRLCAAYL